jgi:hypothetical protein
MDIYRPNPSHSASENQSPRSGVIFSWCARTGCPKSFSPVSEPTHGSTVAYRHTHKSTDNSCVTWALKLASETVHSVRSLDPVLLVSEKRGGNRFSEAGRYSGTELVEWASRDDGTNQVQKFVPEVTAPGNNRHDV